MSSLAPITSFKGPWSFLSNFHPCPLVYDGRQYQTSEHAYQAAKTLIESERASIQQAPTPGAAKRLGRKVTLRTDWETAKLDVMRDILAAKFAPGTYIAGLLVHTDGHDLIEGNTWRDTFWGTYNGVGENWLGRLLMERRNKLLGVDQ